jgi:hypothetical protein
VAALFRRCPDYTGTVSPLSRPADGPPEPHRTASCYTSHEASLGKLSGHGTERQTRLRQSLHFDQQSHAVGLVFGLLIRPAVALTALNARAPVRLTGDPGHPSVSPPDWPSRTHSRNPRFAAPCEPSAYLRWCAALHRSRHRIALLLIASGRSGHERGRLGRRTALDHVIAVAAASPRRLRKRTLMPNGDEADSLQWRDLDGDAGAGARVYPRYRRSTHRPARPLATS